MKKKYWRSLFLNVNGLQRLRNSEFFTFYGEFTDRIESYEFEDEFVLFCINELMSHKQAVGLLREWKRAHDVSELIEDRTNKAQGLLRGIRDAIYAADKLKNEENKEDVHLLVYWIKDIKSDMSSNTKAYQSDAIDTMAERLDTDPELAEAVETFGLLGHFTKVVRMKQQMIAYRNLRDNDNTQGKDIRNGLRSRILEDMRLTLGVLEAKAKYDDEDGEFYFEVCRNAEKLFVTAYTQPKARNTRSHNEKHVDSDMQPEEGIDTTFYSEESEDVYGIQNGDFNEDTSDHVEDENNEESL